MRDVSCQACSLGSRQSEDFDTDIGDRNRMLKLRRQRMVFGHRRPFVSQDLDMMAACVEHWFDGKDHARFQYDASTGAAVVQHLRRIMEYLADAMTAKITHR